MYPTKTELISVKICFRNSFNMIRRKKLIELILSKSLNFKYHLKNVKENLQTFVTNLLYLMILSKDKYSAVENELLAIEAVLAEDFKRLDLDISQTTEDKKGITHAFEAHLFPCEDLNECHCSAHVRVSVNAEKYPKQEQPQLEVLSLEGLNPKRHSKALKEYVFTTLREQHSTNDEILYPLVDLIRSFLSLHNYMLNKEQKTKNKKRQDLHNEDEALTKSDPKTEENENEGENDKNDNKDWDEDENDDDNENDEEEANGWDSVVLCDANDNFVSTSTTTSEKREKQKQVDCTPSHSLQKDDDKFELALEELIESDCQNPLVMCATDCLEINRHGFGTIPGLIYASAYRLENTSKDLEVTIGVWLKHFIVSDALLCVLGFQLNDYLGIKMRFSCDYTKDVKKPKSIEVGRLIPHADSHMHSNVHSDVHNKNSTKTDTDTTPGKKRKGLQFKNKMLPFMGNESLQNRLKNIFLDKFWPLSEMAKHHNLQLHLIHKLMVFTHCSFQVAQCAMQKYKDFETAFLRMSEDITVQNISTNADKEDDKSERKLSDEIVSVIAKYIQAEGVHNGIQNKGKEKEKESKEEIANDSETESTTILDASIVKELQDICQSNDKLFKLFDLSETQNNRLKDFLMDVSPLFEHNVLMHIIVFTLYSALTINRRCLVCDLTFPNSLGTARQLLKPSVCKNYLCDFSHCNLELGFDCASYILSHPSIVDLLITFFYVNVKKGKHLQYFPWYVRGIGSSENHQLSFLDSKHQKSANPTLLFEVLQRMPSIDTLIKWSKGGTPKLKVNLTRKSPLLFPLLTWLITSNRAHLRELRSKREKFQGLPNCFQFEFVTSSPEGEYTFQQLCKKAEAHRGPGRGSVFAWHGSPMENWHTILRTGLKNMSNSNQMRNGAAFGSGIYLAPQSGTSYWYCESSQSDTWPLSMFNMEQGYARGKKGHGLYCLALCEVVNHEKLKDPCPHYVVPAEQWIITRYLFLFNTIPHRKNHGSKGRYFDIDANVLMKNYRKQSEGQIENVEHN
ncbi:hypothetical protein RFI_01525 [Reticulomyxa filosa]|uniref:RWD domain-containing protein n=1 Tax=Reticulomyxa filosa TaxID=46433 RepID=X6PCY6_RETFI|nr:hypothetical protein RFI_01525 [Reticulomyxa filosa]|eukprot:ETO35537.1 hypothetical protein RFI_01525 [Reticulomyxa filosa]